LLWFAAMTTTVTMKNQVTLPAAIVAKAGIEAGFRLDWSLGKNGELRAKPLPPLEQVVKSLRGRGKKFLPKGRSAVADLIEERSKEV